MEGSVGCGTAERGDGVPEIRVGNSNDGSRIDFETVPDGIAGSGLGSEGDSIGRVADGAQSAVNNDFDTGRIGAGSLAVGAGELDESAGLNRQSGTAWDNDVALDNVRISAGHPGLVDDIAADDGGRVKGETKSNKCQ